VGQADLPRQASPELVRSDAADPQQIEEPGGVPGIEQPPRLERGQEIDQRKGLAWSRGSAEKRLVAASRRSFGTRSMRARSASSGSGVAVG